MTLLNPTALKRTALLFGAAAVAGMVVFTFFGSNRGSNRLPGTKAPQSNPMETMAIQQFHRTIEPILIEHCYDCRGDGEKRGGLALDEFKSKKEILGNPEVWLKVLKNTRAGIMPPKKKHRLSQTEQATLDDWIIENVLGSPAPPPPPNIPALYEAEGKVQDHAPTQREVLALHREDALCASCHSRMAVATMPAPMAHFFQACG